MDETESHAIKSLFEETRRRLVETGTRNRLVHVNRQSRRSNVLDIINERSDDIYSILVTNQKGMRFIATGSDKSNDSDTPSLAESLDDLSNSDRHKDSLLETRLGPDGLQKRLLKLAKDAKTAEEEQGINILYLALGFLTWYEDKSSSIKREAPLVLMPVELTRNARTSTYDIRARDEDIVTNLPLQERLKGDFGIKLPEIDADEAWTPSTYFNDVAQVIASQDRWSIDPDGMQLGFFSFAKLLMFHDLDPDKWPDGSIAAHDLTCGLLYEGFEPEEPIFGAEDRLDEKLAPHDIFHVVDADASQTKVIEEVRKGRNLVVQGPPGTGKSQTITNIIAAAARDGKRVLFVAEKMAALSVVHKRLLDTGLEDICLELHSKTANKRAVHEEIGRTLHSGRAVPSMPDAPDQLKNIRDNLNNIAAELHRRLEPSDETPYAVLAQQINFIGAGTPPPKLASDALAAIPRHRAQELAAIIRSYGAALAVAGPRASHPYYGVERCDLQPTDLARLEHQLREAVLGARKLSNAVEAANDALGVDMPVTSTNGRLLADQLDQIHDAPTAGDARLASLIALPMKERLGETLNAGASWKRLKDDCPGVFIDAAWAQDAGHLRAPLVAGQSSFFTRWGSAYRRASRELAGILTNALPKTAAERTDLVDLLLEEASLRQAWREDENWAATTLSDDWRGDRTEFASLSSALTWADNSVSHAVAAKPEALVSLGRDGNKRGALLEAIKEADQSALPAINAIGTALQLDLPAMLASSEVSECNLELIADRFEAMADAISRYEEWANLQRLRQTLIAEDLVELLPPLEDSEQNGEAAATEFLYARAEAIWKAALDSNKAIADLRNVDRHALVKEFASLEKARRKDAVTSIKAAHLSQLPQGVRGGMAVVRGELAKRSRHIPLRKLFSNAAEAIQRIKPVLLMSPISVAQFLPPAAIKFDLLIIDEASQVRPEDALGAIARADQIVVVGDQKQLPPSAFFDRLASNGNDGDDGGDEEDEDVNLLDGGAKAAELESILTLCEARGLPPRLLEWHYRSRDPSLIAVSNAEFYRSGLILPPSPLQNDPSYGLTFNHVAGAYDRGGKRDNRLEGRAVVERVKEHAEQTPRLSLGIVTFSSAQRNLITELLEYERRQDTTLDEFLREGRLEDVFVKNIENVQGDERDVILVSVGYGPSEPGGRFANMNFGPINNEGGERRLNVLFTRARLRCEVFASFDPGDIDLSKTSKEGPRVLKRFLEFAKTGQMVENVPTGDGADTPFEADVAAAITAMGYIVDHQVGSSGFLIDLGIRHSKRPGTYILAIECDGSTYHSALWARERDRLRQDVLEHLGWKFHRIWSTDWFYRRAGEVERLRNALDQALSDSEKAVVMKGANDGDRPTKLVSKAPVEPIIVTEPVERKMPPYRKSQVSVRSYVEPHQADAMVLAKLAAQIVEDEGPIHEEEVARRISSAFGKERAGNRIMAAAQRALKNAQRRELALLQTEGPFWLTTAQALSPSVRDRSGETGTLTKAAYIAMAEINAALRISLEDNAGGSDADIVRTAARLFGFRRVGSDLQERLQSGLDKLRKS